LVEDQALRCRKVVSMTMKANKNTKSCKNLRSIISTYKAKSESLKKESDAVMFEAHQDLKMSTAKAKLELKEIANR
jgi:hypothetical protein